ncbi:MAG: putative toxin-antitoxin system toxin component, PIN family [Deltaproteobacteria bacterium]|nr:putative toxin-antitoxin system toxin component, PIN family [Deltaproteobacteria bacterium]
MRIVVDTNVFISGVFFSGPPYKILNAWRDGLVQLIVSEEILNEYREVGDRLQDSYPNVDPNPFLELVVKNAKLVVGAKLDNQICDDPDDDKFFSCAVSGKCRLVVSGDKHLLNASGYRKIEVVKPRDFLERYLRH